MNATEFIRALMENMPLIGQQESRGIIHVGANTGQECHQYHDGDLNVLWIEAHPNVFRTLLTNIARFPKQQAICQLLSDKDDVPTSFYETSNNSESSSILELGLHSEMFPDITCISSAKMSSLTLTTLIKRNNIDLSLFDTLLLDIQGAELIVLSGAEDILANFKHIVAEAADFDVYKGCGRLEQIDNLLGNHGFTRAQLCRFPNEHGYQYVVGYLSKQPR